MRRGVRRRGRLRLQLLLRTGPGRAHLPHRASAGRRDRRHGGARARAIPARHAPRWASAPGEPFVLCVGRVERAKGSHVLAELWRLYRQRRPSAPRLVLLGPVHEGLEATTTSSSPVGNPKSVKWGALQACEFAITPSAWESFSLVVLEAWLAGAPVVVNRRCAATLEHCRAQSGRAVVLRLRGLRVRGRPTAGDRALRARLVANGRALHRARLQLAGHRRSLRGPG